MNVLHAVREICRRCIAKAFAPRPYKPRIYIDRPPRPDSRISSVSSTRVDRTSLR